MQLTRGITSQKINTCIKKKKEKKSELQIIYNVSMVFVYDHS